MLVLDDVLDKVWVKHWEYKLWITSKGSPNGIFIAVSICINYMDNSTFCWCGKGIKEERGDKMKKRFLVGETASTLAPMLMETRQMPLGRNRWFPCRSRAPPPPSSKQSPRPPAGYPSQEAHATSLLIPPPAAPPESATRRNHDWRLERARPGARTSMASTRAHRRHRLMRPASEPGQAREHRNGEHDHHRSTAATRATEVSTRARRLTSTIGAPRYYSYSIAINRRSPSPIYSSRCSIFCTILCVAKCNWSPHGRKGTTCSMKCIWHMMMDEATYYLYF
jgi:hypothetical protein